MGAIKRRIVDKATKEIKTIQIILKIFFALNMGIIK
jgi:hypothetical protein